MHGRFLGCCGPEQLMRSRRTTTRAQPRSKSRTCCPQSARNGSSGPRQLKRSMRHARKRNAKRESAKARKRHHTRATQEQKSDMLPTKYTKTDRAVPAVKEINAPRAKRKSAKAKARKRKREAPPDAPSAGCHPWPLF
ncbi:hypothetical protein T492DRAFT_1021921 [Pavlovales sp. CCMP2436]|nr:hypothetical protein T492DRAFT_1021921 [Pavlovales sp. CCMP2436]